MPTSRTIHTNTKSSPKLFDNEEILDRISTLANSRSALASFLASEANFTPFWIGKKCL
jgi:hypothetical protein